MTAWYEDPRADLDWNNYSRGWDQGYADKRNGHTRDLTGHGQPYVDGYTDGIEAANHH